MKKLLILSLIFCFLFALDSFSQVTNLKVNGNSTNFTMASGDIVSWSYDVPNPGDTTLLDFWIDTNNNGELDSDDVLWAYFDQIDGDNHGQNGPPDMDGSVNSQVTFQQKVGLAPGHYVLSFKNNNSSVTIPGTVTVLNSVTFTISGHITVPSGFNKENIVVGIESKSNGGTFWNSLTNSNGDYIISMDSDTTGNPWQLNINNAFIFKSATISPQKIELTLDSSVSKQYANNDFTITAASASISGNVTDEDGNPVVNANVNVNSYIGSFERYVNSDFEGKYFIGLSSDDLPQNNLNIGSWQDSNKVNVVQFNYNLPSINLGDSVIHNIFLFKINSAIRGTLTLNGNAPGMTDIFASCSDTGYIRTMTDNSGYFEFKVTDKISNYAIYAGQIPQGYINDSIVVHAGDTTANLNLLTLTDVRQTDLNVPKNYSLSQNYPNPFNPSTVIKYQIPNSTFVSLKVYDILGNEVGTLVNETMNTGSYEIKFDGSNLSSGIYFYQLKTNGYTATKKLILLK